MKILLLEDEFMLARSVRTYLLARGHLVDHYDNGQEVLEAIETQVHDFYLLDINTPLVGGLECLKAIASKYPLIPKIIISAYHDVSYISEAFSTGCSDYLKKPFSLKELEIRIAHLTAQVQHTPEIQYEPMIHLSKHYTFNKESNFLYYDGTIQNFTKREYSLVTMFVSNLGQIMTDESIRSFVWDGDEAEPSTIRSLVNRVRSKLKEELIDNVRGFGYVMKKGKGV